VFTGKIKATHRICQQLSGHWFSAKLGDTPHVAAGISIKFEDALWK
jgi:hypothetical protein